MQHSWVQDQKCSSVAENRISFLTKPLQERSRKFLVSNIWTAVTVALHSDLFHVSELISIIFDFSHQKSLFAMSDRGHLDLFCISRSSATSLFSTLAHLVCCIPTCLSALITCSLDCPMSLPTLSLLHPHPLSNPHLHTLSPLSHHNLHVSSRTPTLFSSHTHFRFDGKGIEESRKHGRIPSGNSNSFHR